MSPLEHIQQTVQKTAEAIADVLKIEVEIADENLVRVAGTGQYQENCGQVMQASFVYQHVLATGEMVLIENPGQHELCRPCPQCGQCFEYAELATPILSNDRPIGVIGLVSFDPVQAKRLLENKEWMLQFIVKMAELIINNLPNSATGQAAMLPLNLGSLEKEAIVKALGEVEGQVRRKEKAAKMLGISRATLYRKIKEYELI